MRIRADARDSKPRPKTGRRPGLRIVIDHLKITIRQFGGHKGSFAGDCALIEIDAGVNSQVVVIDTGASKVWSKTTEFRDWVRRALPANAKAPRTLITTHFHADHFDEGRASAIKWDHWFHADVFQAKGGSRTVVKGSGHVIQGKADGYDFFVDCYAPDWSKVSAKEENDMSLAVAVYVSDGVDGFRFLSFGDMTKAGEAQLPMGSLFPCEVAKYPHHGSEKNYLKYFGWGLCETAVISGDSGSAATSIAQLFDDGVKKVRVVARTDEATSSVVDSWKTKCMLYKKYAACDMKVGTDLVVTWSGGSDYSLSF